MKLVFAALLLIAPLAAAPRIYLLHDEPAPMKQLAAYLEENGHPAVIEDQAEFRKHLSTTSAEAIFMYVHGDLAPDITDYLIRYAETGGRLIILHHGMASGKIRNPRWLGFLGVSILPKDAKENAWAVLRGDYELVNLNPAHYVTTHKVEYPKTVEYTPSDTPSASQQLPVLELPDTELFLNQLFTDGRRKTVLFGMKGTIAGKTYMQDRAAWTMPTGSGRVFYFQPGHFARDFQNKTYAQILLNAVEWQPTPGSAGAAARRNPSRN